MWKFLLILFSFISANSYSQKVMEGYGIMFDNRNLNYLNIIFNNNPNSFLLLVQKDFGEPLVQDNKVLKQELHWDNVTIANLEDTIIVKIGIIPAKNQAYLFIVCFDSNGNDLLIPKSHSQRIIIEYFKIKLKK